MDSGAKALIVTVLILVLFITIQVQLVINWH